MKDTKGVTLMALIITIIILLILVGITIMYVIGDNGIFQKAQNAKNKTEEAIKNEQEYMNQVDNIINGYASGAGNGEGTGNLTGGPIETVKSDWQIIEKIAKEIAKDESITNETEKVIAVVDNKRYVICVGDILEVEYDGEARRVRILGFKHDDLVDQTVYGGNHTKASISFEFLDFMTGSTYRGMNNDNTSSGGWGNTKMRKDLNGYTTNSAIQNRAIGGLGANLNNKAYIKQVSKKYIATYNNANSVTVCNDFLWLLAASEVVNNGYNGAGSYGYAITEEGKQYKYYQGVIDAWEVESAGRIKKAFGLESTGGWWLRSPNCDYDGGFCLIGSAGVGTGRNLAGYVRYGIAPGFCI